MPLKDLTLFGERDKVAISIERLKTFEPPEGYWVAVSGGKDSTVIYDLVKRSGVKATFHHNLTTIDPPEVVWHIRKHQPDVVIHPPKMPLLKMMIEKQRCVPTHQKRWCCKYYKECGGVDRRVVTGIRSAESHKRASRKMVEECTKYYRKTYIHPILDWSDNDVWEYINSKKLPYCSLYDEGFKRIGCVMCPIIGGVELMRHRARWPKIERAWHRAVIETYSKSKSAKRLFKDGEAYWNWWVNRKPIKNDIDQTTLFE